MNLGAGDVWKYGETTNVSGRYSDNWLRSSGLRQVNEFYGNQVQNKVMEKTRFSVTSYRTDTYHQEIKYLGKMNFEIVINELDEEMSGKLPLVKELSTLINKSFIDKFYGNDLKALRLIFILIKTKHGYEEWFKVRKPKYIEHNVLETFSGEKIEINKEFAIEYRIDNKDYDNFLQATEEESKRILALEILNSLSNLDALPKKVKNFDKERFKSDIEVFFKSEKLT